MRTMKKGILVHHLAMIKGNQSMQNKYSLVPQVPLLLHAFSWAVKKIKK
jgi:hypothetical protein